MSKQHLVLIVISTYCLVASCTHSQSINPAWQQQKEQPSTETSVTSEEPKGPKVPNRLFLQQVSSSSAIIKWRGDQNEVWYGTKRNDLSARKSAEQERNHKLVFLNDLEPDTRYYYGFKGNGSRETVMSFSTAPRKGALPSDGNTHIWLLGDSGTATEKSLGHYSHAGEAIDVMNGFLKYNQAQANSEPLDLLLLLGDNAYVEGTDEQWQGAFFDIYTDIIHSVSTWPTIGNHEMGVGAPFDVCLFRKLPACEAGPLMIHMGGISTSADPDSYDSTGDGPDAYGLPYLNIFSLPSRGELGGVPSGTEQYYAFDYGNVHIVSLDSQLSNRDKDQRAAMRDWLIDDLSANQLDWTIVIFHHPPYSKGSNHDSDREQNEIDMRQTFAPVFEDYGVDVVYSGHAHSYERSWYVNGHHGMSDTFDPATQALLNVKGEPSMGQQGELYPQLDSSGADKRTVYTVAGSSGKADRQSPCAEGQFFGCTLPNWLEHPVHRTFDEAKPGYRKNGLAIKGSVVIDAGRYELTSRFIDEHGDVHDYFTIIRGTR